MRNLFYLTLFFCLTIGLYSCTEDIDSVSNLKHESKFKIDVGNTEYSSTPQNQEIFATTLSKALYNDKDVVLY